MENIMLHTLQYELMVPTAYDFVRALCTILHLDSQTTALATYLTELSILDGERFLRYLPSVIAIAAIALSRYTFQVKAWYPCTDDVVWWGLRHFQTLPNLT
jgi:cyclin A